MSNKKDILRPLHLYRAEELKPRLPALRGWLEKNGAQIHRPHTDWEILRAYSANGVCLVLYRNAAGRLSFDHEVERTWDNFRRGAKWHLAPVGEKFSGIAEKNSIIESILARDGETCVFCGKVPERYSMEHLLDRSNGGGNHLSNLALACIDCNQEASGIKNLRAKIEHIITKRRSLSCSG